jgi:glycosyltransferase involved in cell wall biosynthesis
VKSQCDQRVAIFQAEWPVHFQTANAVMMFADAGYEVDLFLFDTPTFVELEGLKRQNRVHIHHLTVDTSRMDVNASRPRVKEYLRNLLPVHVRSVYHYGRQAYLLLRGSEKELLPSIIWSQALDAMAGKKYRCLIGVEKQGLIWAGKVAERLAAPLVYYSLELYTREFQRLKMRGSLHFSRLRQAEQRYHRKAHATIIQDPARARLLFEDTGVPFPKANIFYVPVSVLGKTYEHRSWFLHKSLEIPKDQKIVLYFGQIKEDRCVMELVRAAQRFPAGWTLVMHGWGKPSTIEKIRSLDNKGRAALSLELLPSDRIREAIASADIGLALYASVPQNDRLTAFSSEKMALYMQCGVPFVAFDYPGYRQLAEKDRCGEVIQTIDQLPAAIDKVLNAHHEYHQNAYSAFFRHYDFASNFSTVIDGIERLA